MMLAAMPKTQSHVRHGGTFETSPFRGFGEVSIAPLPPNSPANPPYSRTGAALAVSNLTLGVAPHLPSSTGRGGARNCATRESHALSAAQVGNLMAATAYAYSIGLPFTRMITIHWGAAGVPLATMAKATGKFTDLLAKALARHGNATALIWTHEKGGGKDGHCHLLAHVPAELVAILTRLQKRWLRSITGSRYRVGVILSKPIGGRLGLELGNPALHAINLASALAYLLKGASPDVALQFGLTRLEPGGRVIGKRCGTSQNIGAKARKTKD